MPNWCTNEVSVYADSKKELEEFISFVKSKEDEEAFSFQSILPMPEELRGTTSPANIITQEEYDNINPAERARIDDPNNPFVTRSITEEMSNRYIEQYGHNNWYDWANTNWGTKWEVAHVEMSQDSDCEVEYEFDTAWCPPEGIFDALEKKFPKLSISWFYREDGNQMSGWL